MYTECEGLILRQIKTLAGRRMIVLFTKKYGKISAGTSISEKGKNKSALALRPFTYGRYELFKGRDSFNINGAETIESFYSLGEDVDKYMAASYALELTDRLVMEDQPLPMLFSNLYEYLSMLQKRKTSFDTLTLGYMLKALSFVGSAPILNMCAKCQKTDDLKAFSVPDGGFVCSEHTSLNPLIFEASCDIISAMQFMDGHSLKALENLALKDDVEKKMLRILKAYYSYHLGIENLKSEGLKI